MDSGSTPSQSPPARHSDVPLSYKFQRLRERLRAAVACGELTGKLPGERALARRFQVNAKTLSKALTDLAAEGLLDRSIGRGTYVKCATADASATAAKQRRPARWLIVCEADRAAACPIVKTLREISPLSTLIHDVTAMRPSFLKQFDAAIDLSLNTPERFLRDLLVRNFPVVTVNREPDLFSVNSVCTDRSLAANHLTRDLILGGHSHIAVVESLPRSVVARAVKLAATRYGPHAIVHVCPAEELVGAIQGGATAVICDSAACARDARTAIEAAGLRVPHDACLTAIDSCDADVPCSGHYVEGALLARTVADLLSNSSGGQRPTTLWLAPKWIDRGTTRPLPSRSAEGEAA